MNLPFDSDNVSTSQQHRSYTDQQNSNGDFTNTQHVSTNTINQNDGQPIPLNLNTPTIPYDWPINKRQTLNKWKSYAENLVIYMHYLELEGPNTDKEIPKNPRESLQTLLNKHTSKSKPLLGVLLHEYLLSHIADMKDVVVFDLDSASVETMIPTLVQGYTILKQQNARRLQFYLDYGRALNKAFDCFRVQKLNGDFSSNITWKTWVESHIGISDRYAKQIRNIAAEFGSYKRLRYLGISLNEFVKRKEAICLMFKQYPELDAFWKQDPTQQN